MMIKKAVKTVFKFLFKPILNRYHLMLDKLDLILKRIEIWNSRELPPPYKIQFLTLSQIEAFSGCCNDDVRLIEKFADPNTVSHEDYYTDFFGIRTSSMALSIKHMCGTVNHELPFPSDNFHAFAV